MNPGTVHTLDGMIDRGRDYPPTQAAPDADEPQYVDDLIAELRRAYLPRTDVAVSA